MVVVFSGVIAGERAVIALLSVSNLLGLEYRGRCAHTVHPTGWGGGHDTFGIRYWGEYLFDHGAIP